MILVIFAALSLETLSGYFPSLKLILNMTLIGLLIVVLFSFWKFPLYRIGAYFSSGLAHALGFAILFGFMPQGFSYAILDLIFPGSVIINPNWLHVKNPSSGTLLLIVSFLVLYLNTLIGEEAGWRGYLVRGMAEKYSRGKLVWLSSLLFAFWHIPYDLIIFHMDPINLMLNQTVRFLNGAAFAYFFVATRWSLIPVALFHTIYNFVLYRIVNPSGPFLPQLTNIQGLLFLIIQLIITVAVLLIVRQWAIRKGNWSPIP